MFSFSLCCLKPLLRINSLEFSTGSYGYSQCFLILLVLGLSFLVPSLSIFTLASSSHYFSHGSACVCFDFSNCLQNISSVSVSFLDCQPRPRLYLHSFLSSSFQNFQFHNGNDCLVLPQAPTCSAFGPNRAKFEP